MAAPAVIPKLLSFAEIAISPGGDIYATPLGTTVARVGLIVINNPDGSPHTFTLRSSLGASVVDDAHCLYKDVAIAAGATKVYRVPRALGDGSSVGRLHAESDANLILKCYTYGAELDTLHADIGRAIPKQPVQVQLTTSPQSLIGSVGTISQVLMSLTLCNVDAAPHDVRIIYAFFPTDVYTTITVPANDTLELEDLLIADPAAPGAGGLTILADANSVVTATVSVVDVDIS
jgi:hypothetical protein